MAETELERIKGLEVKTDNHTKILDDHEKRIDKLESISIVVGQLNDVVKQQGENIDKLSKNTSIAIDKLSESTSNTIEKLSENTNNAVEKLTSIISDVKKSTERLEVMQAKIEIRQDYYLVDGIKTLVKKIGIKGFIAIGSVVAAILTALHILG